MCHILATMPAGHAVRLRIPVLPVHPSEPRTTIVWGILQPHAAAETVIRVAYRHHGETWRTTIPCGAVQDALAYATTLTLPLASPTEGGCPMALSAAACTMLHPGDRILARLLPGRDPVVVTLETLGIDRDATGVPRWATLTARTVFGNLVTLSSTDIVRRAS